MQLWALSGSCLYSACMKWEIVVNTMLLFSDAPDQVIGGHADDHQLLDTVQALDLEEGSKCKVPLARKHLATRVVSSR